MTRAAVLGVLLSALLACRSEKPPVRPTPPLSRDAYANYLEARSIACPVLPVDVREQVAVIQLLELLLLQLENKTEVE